MILLALVTSGCRDLPAHTSRFANFIRVLQLDTMLGFRFIHQRINLGEFDEYPDREASQQPISTASPEYVLVSLAVVSLAVHHPL